MKLTINGKAVDAGDLDPNTPLLWVLRDELDMTGTKFGCGMGLCGACTVHLDGKATRSCSVPVGQVKQRKVTTIEGLSPDVSHPLQEAWQEVCVPQCGYCQPGQLMCAAALLSEKKSPNDDDIDAAMAGNLCRCGAYPRIRAAIKQAAKEGK